MNLTPPEGYEPLSDAALADIDSLVGPEDTRDWLRYRLAARDLLRDTRYWRARALAAERRFCPSEPHYHCLEHPGPTASCNSLFKDDMGGDRCADLGFRAGKCHEVLTE